MHAQSERHSPTHSPLMPAHLTKGEHSGVCPQRHMLYLLRSSSSEMQSRKRGPGRIKPPWHPCNAKWTAITARCVEAPPCVGTAALLVIGPGNCERSNFFSNRKFD